MLELTQEQIKQIRYNKIKELKSLIKDYGLAIKHNKYAGRTNASLLDKCKAKSFVESGYYQDYTKIKLYEQMIADWENTNPYKDIHDTRIYVQFVKEFTYWSVKCVDKNGKELTIMEPEMENIDGIFITLYHIAYNKLKNKKRGHTHDDNEYIQRYQAYWNFITERMALPEGILEAYHGTP